MTRDVTLREIQKRIAEAKGWGVPWGNDFGNLTGFLDGEERTVPQWPQQWHRAGELLDEMTAADIAWTIRPQSGNIGTVQSTVCTEDAKEATARCWCAWKGIDLSDL